MNRLARALLISSGALLVLLAPTAASAQLNRYAFGYQLGSNPANDGTAYLTINGTTVNTSARGKYYSAGSTDGNTNFLTGVGPGTESRGWFAFDLSNLRIPATTASLTLFNCDAATCGHDGFGSPNPSESINIFDVSSSLDALVGGTGGVSAFNDLGTGSLYGTQSVSNASDGQNVTFTFNAAGLAAVNGKLGGLFLSGSAMDLGVTTTTPEPSTWMLSACGLLVIGGFTRRRRA